MAKVKKTFRIEEDIYDELVELSTEWSVSQGAAVERAIRFARQIAKLMETVADSTKAVQGAQALHHETAQTLALESTEQKLSRWQRLRRAWRG